jgi:CRP-like cAMP-binding protein
VIPTEFEHFANKHGKKEKYAAGQVFHTQDFPNRLFLLRSGYVKRYQASKPGPRVLELIYGPGHIISLSQLYKRLFGVDQNQDNFIYVYQTMTDVELYTISGDAVLEELERNPHMFADFFYESGLKLRSNITRLASNSLKDDYQKVAHQIVSLAYEFAGVSAGDTRKEVTLPLPQTAVDIAEQLNISVEVAEAVLNRLGQLNLIKIADGTITIVDMDFLKDVYL